MPSIVLGRRGKLCESHLIGSDREVAWDVAAATSRTLRESARRVRRGVEKGENESIP